MSDTPKPKYRTYTVGGLARAADAEEFSKPQVVYQFSNGVKKVDTDRTDKGIYKR